ncbi:STM4011 family radical SAM protein [Aquisphaera insulae]|uniref:STM4011 family radical SAM protein n=1 Tax=Aquisphaera insulae TaxID=2712864 RepID=UPI0013EB3BEA
MSLSILYRGPLSSCNYACGYCPFAKRRESHAGLAADREALARFVGWVESRAGDHFSVLFTPWGEALTRRWYRDAIVRLTNLAHIERAAIQTNLSGRLDWVARCDASKVAIWATYHPGEVTRSAFLDRCRQLTRLGIRHSVGVVGLKEHLGEIEALRRELPADVYLWVNAYKREPDYYPEDAIRFLEAIDPLFPVNNRRHPSLGRSCRTGHSVIAVDGAGTIRRCHFVPDEIGNIYEPGFESALLERPCPASTCSCHIGYVHLDHLGLAGVFGQGILERIPEEPVWRSPEHRSEAPAVQASTSGR